MTAREVTVSVSGWPTVLGGNGMFITVADRTAPFDRLEDRITGLRDAMVAVGAAPAFVDDMLAETLARVLGTDPVDTIPERDHRGHLLWLAWSGTRKAGQ